MKNEMELNLEELEMINGGKKKRETHLKDLPKKTIDILNSPGTNGRTVLETGLDGLKGMAENIADNLVQNVVVPTLEVISDIATKPITDFLPKPADKSVHYIVPDTAYMYTLTL